jgi:hypothetical protein
MSETEEAVHSQPGQSGEPEVVDLGQGVERAVAQLARSLGMVVDLEMIDGSNASGVLGGLNADVVILEHWDEVSQGPNGDPFTVSIHLVRRVVVP